LCPQLFIYNEENEMNREYWPGSHSFPFQLNYLESKSNFLETF
jgi:hypothetical protein